MLIISIIGPYIDVPAFSNPSVKISTIATATVILIVSGILAGLLPAVRAASVKPIIALRAG